MDAIIDRLLAEAAATGQRRAVLLSGDADWCRQQATTLAGGDAATLWVGLEAPTTVRRIDPADGDTVLGEEFEQVVFDAHSGFDPDSFGAAVGTLCGGGLLLLLAPNLAQWPQTVDPQAERITSWPLSAADATGYYLQRLVRVVGDSDGVTMLKQGEANASERPLTVTRYAPSPLENGCLSRDQADAVAALIHVVSGQRRRPVVLTADRGRGKSAALGIAAAELLKQGLRRIIVTAPRPDAALAVFDHAGRHLPGAERGKQHIRWMENGAEQRIDFIAPDRLVQETPEADLVLVDEAAAIPTPLLVSLLAHYPRIAFATTVHGYEGTGRGFAVRFHRILDEKTRGWRALHLTTPVRWAEGDPVEAMVFRALLLDAEPAPAEPIAGATPDTITIEPVSQQALAEDESLLRQLFGLLVTAHYRTKPLDLRHLLDGSHVDVWLARYQGQVVATVLMNNEGGFDEAKAAEIVAGSTRPRGHLLPEALAAHLGSEQAPALHTWRVMRIATHPVLHRQGIGTRLLQVIAERAEQEGIDLLGSSFGATPELLRFWQRADMGIVRVSVKRSASSGAHSVIVLRGTSPDGRALTAQLRQRYLELLPLLMGDALTDIEADLGLALFHAEGNDFSHAGLNSWDRRDLEAFAHGGRIFESVMAPLWMLAWDALTSRNAGLSDAQRRLLLVRLFQRCNWQESAERLGMAGRNEVIQALKQTVAQMLK